eukprot:7290701-Pyramimonas_sp.AAC.1
MFPAKHAQYCPTPQVTEGALAAWREARAHQFTFQGAQHLVHGLLHLVASSCECAAMRGDTEGAARWCAVAEDTLAKDNIPLIEQPEQVL